MTKEAISFIVSSLLELLSSIFCILLETLVSEVPG